MPVIYCSACADTSSLAANQCLHCGAVAQRSYEHTPSSLAALVVVMAVSFMAIWAFSRGSTAHKDFPYHQDAFNPSTNVVVTVDADHGTAVASIKKS